MINDQIIFQFNSRKLKIYIIFCFHTGQWHSKIRRDGSQSDSELLYFCDFKWVDKKHRIWWLWFYFLRSLWCGLLRWRFFYTFGRTVDLTPQTEKRSRTRITQNVKIQLINRCRQGFYMKTQIGKNHKEGRENSLSFESYIETQWRILLIYNFQI